MPTAAPLKVVYHGCRHAVFVNETSIADPKTVKWICFYLVSLLSAYCALSVWWLILPSYPILFWMWMIGVPIWSATWGVQQRKHVLMVALAAGGVAWFCDFMMIAMLEGD